MSASDTGDDAPLVQFFSSVRNNDSASAPASRTVSRQQRGVARQNPVVAYQRPPSVNPSMRTVGALTP